MGIPTEMHSEQLFRLRAGVTSQVKLYCPSWRSHDDGPMRFVPWPLRDSNSRPKTRGLIFLNLAPWPIWPIGFRRRFIDSLSIHCFEIWGLQSICVLWWDSFSLCRWIETRRSAICINEVDVCIVSDTIPTGWGSPSSLSIYTDLMNLAKQYRWIVSPYFKTVYGWRIYEAEIMPLISAIIMTAISASKNVNIQAYIF